MQIWLWALLLAITLTSSIQGLGMARLVSWHDRYVMMFIVRQAEIKSWDNDEVKLYPCDDLKIKKTWPSHRICYQVGGNVVSVRLWSEVQWRGGLGEDVLRVKQGWWSHNGSFYLGREGGQVTLIHSGWMRRIDSE